MNTPGVVIVGATNHAERIDPALMRAGRLERTIRIELPDTEAIAAILARYIGAGADGTDLTALAHRLVGQTGADIEKLVRTAKATARRAGRMFSIADIEAQVPDPFQRLLPRVRRRIAIYRNAQRIVAQALGLTEMTSRPGDLTRQMAKTLAEERFHTEQTCNDVLAVIMAGRASERSCLGTCRPSAQAFRIRIWPWRQRLPRIWSSKEDLEYLASSTWNVLTIALPFRLPACGGGLRRHWRARRRFCLRTPRSWSARVREGTPQSPRRQT